MDFNSIQKKLRAAQMGRTVLAVISLVLLAGNLTLSYALLSQSNQIVLVPTNVSDGMVARGSVDKRYVEALSLDAVYALYNASPSTLDYGRSVVERLSAVSQRNNILKHYDDVANDIRERDISTVFYPNTIEHNFDEGQVVIEGVLHTYLNTVLVDSKPRKLMLTFVVEAGSTRLSKINKLEVSF